MTGFYFLSYRTHVAIWALNCVAENSFVRKCDLPMDCLMDVYVIMRIVETSARPQIISTKKLQDVGCNVAHTWLDKNWHVITRSKHDTSRNLDARDVLIKRCFVRVMKGCLLQNRESCSISAARWKSACLHNKRASCFSLRNSFLAIFFLARIRNCVLRGGELKAGTDVPNTLFELIVNTHARDLQQNISGVC